MCDAIKCKYCGEIVRSNVSYDQVKIVLWHDPEAKKGGYHPICRIESIELTAAIDAAKKEA